MQRTLKKFFTSATLGFILVTNAIGQTNDEMEPLRARLANYNNIVLEEKIFVHTDKQLYQAGDIMWFKVYCVDSRLNHPLNLSKVAYLELLDNQSRQVMVAKVNLDSGIGSASVIIPSTLPTGNYLLRSYTYWMKNFSDNFFFRQVITVTNGRRIAPDVKPVILNYTTQLFPEGGHFVNGLENKVAFKVADQYGNGTDFTGYITDQDQDTVARFKPLEFGMGSFRFIPKTGKTYYSIIRFSDGKVMATPLGNIDQEGVVMQVQPDETGKISVKLNTNIPGTSKLYLLVNTRLSLKIAEVLKVVNGEAVYSFSEKALGEGVSTITVFNSAKEAVCERLYFRYPSTLENVKVTADQGEYQNRKKIQLQLRSGSAEEGDFAMAVYQVDSSMSKGSANINSWLWLQSEIKGKIQSPDFYFDEKEPTRKAAMENLLLTQGWRRFNWNDKQGNAVPAFTYEPEYNGIIVNARVIDTRTGAPASGIQAFIGAPGSRTNFISGFSNDSGYLKLEMPDLYGSSELVLQTNSLTADSVYRVDIIQPFLEKVEKDSLPPLRVTAADTTAILDRMISNQVQFIYDADQINRFDTLALDSTKFYSRPDKQYYFDDYTRFTTMEEVLREYVQWVNVRKRENDFHLTVFDAERQVVMTADPLVLMDGVPVFKINKVLELNPLKMQKLDVIAKKYVIGNTNFDGILNFITYNGDLEGFTLDRNATVVDFEGLQLKREFYSPSYDAQDSTLNIPDFRTLLYWKPDIKLKAGEPVNLTFFSSDLKGNYIVVLQGISRNGHCGEAVTRFTVK